MAINKHGNWDYNGAVPYNDGDLYFSPDKIRDFLYSLDKAGNLMAYLCNKAPCVLFGGVVSKGAGDTLDITLGAGTTKQAVYIPDTYASLPPSKVLSYITRLVIFDAQTNLAIPSATLDGSVNYVKVRYAETNGNTRTRAYTAGSYSYERVESYTITVSTVAPDGILDLVLASFTCPGTGQPFTFSTATRPIPDIHGNISTASGILETGVGASVLHTKIIDIGDWDMDANAFTNFAHGMSSNYTKIRSISVVIRNDDSSKYMLLNQFYDHADATLVGGGIYYWDSTNIYLYRRTGGIFDSTEYNATSYNRGYVTIEYID